MRIRLETATTGNNQSFKGFELKKDERGKKYYSFSYPFDPNKYTCYLEIFGVAPDRNGDYDKKGIRPLRNYAVEGQTEVYSKRLLPGENKVYLNKDFRLANNAPFAYHYSLVPNTNKSAPPIYKIEAGDVIGHADGSNCKELYNLVVPIGNIPVKAGAAILVFADNFDARWMYDKQGNIVPNPDAKKNLEVYKNFGNSVGGSLAGIHKALLDGRLDVYNRIFTLPLTSGDKNTGYWLESGFQLTPSCGNVDNYEKFHKDLFRKGKTLVLDSPFTSEGLGGIHVQSILKYGEDDVFFNWFNCSSLKDMNAKTGVFGKRSKFIRHRLVNAPFKVFQEKSTGRLKLVERSGYDSKRPTYVQVYNADQVTKEQLEDASNEIFQYGNPSGSRPLSYGTHNDSIITYSFPIDPKEYEKNVKDFNEYNAKQSRDNKVPFNSYQATRILTKFSGFEFENKIPGGFYNWNSNVDMNQFDFAPSNEMIEEAFNVDPEYRHEFYKMKSQKQAEVLDYAVSSLNYWTKKTSQDLNLYVAQSLKGINNANASSMVKEAVKDGKLPQKVSEQVNKTVIKNVMNDEYILQGVNKEGEYGDLVLEGIMDYPMEATEFGKDILALFSTPYITNRATTLEDVGRSRFELLQDGNPHLTPQYESIYGLTTDMYTKQMLSFAKSILEEVNKQLPKDSKLTAGDEVSDYGKYVIPQLTKEIAKFAIVKSLAPDIKYTINKETGKISYDYDAMKKVSLQTLGINTPSQEMNAEQLVKKLRNGISQIPQSDRQELAKSLYKMIEGTNAKSFEMAEMIVDRTQAGVDWRIDAAKDFANIDSIRNHDDNFEDSWERVIGIIKAMTKGIRKANPNSYIVAEVTDEVDLHKMGNPENSERFYYKDNDRNDIVRKFEREAKVDAIANYSHFFNGVPEIFGKRGEDGDDYGLNQGNRIHDTLSMYKDKFLYSGPYGAVINSYTFADNHDKPRINHVFSLDMGLFYANLNDERNYDYRKRAYQVLNPDKAATSENINKFDYTYVSSMAVARGEALNSAFYKSVEELSHKKDNFGRDIISSEEKEKLRNELKQVVAQLAAGKYKGEDYEADNFGAEEVHKVIQTVIEEYAANNPSLTEEFKKQLFDETFKQALNPALSNTLPIDKFLVNLPGIPTTYAGADVGATGYETKTWNVFQKNRSPINHDFAEEYDFIRDRKNDRDNVKLLRSRPATHALNDGTPYLLKLQQTIGQEPVTALYRYATDGSAVISLFNTAGTTHTYDKYSDPGRAAAQLKNNRIDLSQEGPYIGLHGGLPERTKFVNANDKNDVYYVYKGHGTDEYYLAKDEQCKQPITLTDNTLTLYSVSEALQREDDLFMEKVKKAREEKVSFCGNKCFENKVYNVAGVRYSSIPVTPNKTKHSFDITSKQV